MQHHMPAAGAPGTMASRCALCTNITAARCSTTVPQLQRVHSTLCIVSGRTSCVKPAGASVLSAVDLHCRQHARPTPLLKPRNSQLCIRCAYAAAGSPARP
jgi:hypothetical protein